MDKNVRQLIKQINDGKNLKENLSLYLSLLAESYHRTSLLNLAMEYYVLYEQMNGELREQAFFAEDTLKTINRCMEAVFMDKDNGLKENELLETLSSQRKQIIEKMKILTSYTDSFIIYEHVLNRMELNYGPFVMEEREEEFIQRLTQYIFSTKEDAVVNEKVKQVIGQLPVRMAKSRYFELIKNSLSVYIGSEKASVDTYDYMLRTCAMLYKPKGMDQYFTDFGKLKKELEDADFNQLTKEEHDSLAGRVREAAQLMTEITDLYMTLQGVLNHLYAHVLSGNLQRGEEDAAHTASLEIIREIYEEFQQDGGGEPLQSTTDKFILTEGKLEQLIMTQSLLEGAFEDMRSYSSPEGEFPHIQEEFKKVSLCSSLMSDSLFIDFEEVDTETADQAYVQQVIGALIHDLDEAFKMQHKKVKRAVIAGTISMMPVFFKSSKEVLNYIENSLAQCRDAGEKQVSMHILDELMKEDW